jgi:hypothetical protein
MQRAPLLLLRSLIFMRTSRASRVRRGKNLIYINIYTNNKNNRCIYETTYQRTRPRIIKLV